MILLWLACTSAPTDDPCADQPFEEMRTTCRVSAAARAGSSGDAEAARVQCELIQEQKWRSECYFRAGEELGKAGYTDASLRTCAKAGDFTRNCITHAAWGLPPDPKLKPADAAATAAAMEEFAHGVDLALADAGAGVVGEGLDTLIARAWFNLYFGAGDANPAAARAASPPQAAHARTAWALEAVRLLGCDTERVRRTWIGELPAPTGEALDPRRRVGHYTSPIIPNALQTRPHVPLFGGGARLSAADPDTDLLVATLEACFFRGDTPSDVFAPWRADSRAEVAYTAIKLWAFTAPDAELEAWTPPDATASDYAAHAAKRRRAGRH